MKTLIKTITGNNGGNLVFKISDDGITIRSTDVDILAIDDLLFIILNDFDLIKCVIKYLNDNRKMYHLQPVTVEDGVNHSIRKIYMYKIDEYNFPDELVATFEIYEQIKDDDPENNNGAFIMNLNKCIENLDIGILLELCRCYTATELYIEETLKLSKKQIRKRRREYMKYVKPINYINSPKIFISDLNINDGDKLILNNYNIDYQLKKAIRIDLDIRRSKEDGDLLININNQEHLIVFKEWINSILEDKWNNIVNNRNKDLEIVYSINDYIYDNHDFIINMSNSSRIYYYIKGYIKLHKDSFDLIIYLCEKDIATMCEHAIDDYKTTIFV